MRRFGVKRHGTPIEQHPLKAKGVKPAGITTKIDPITGISLYSEYEAMTAANATLDEIYKWRMGLYPRWFKAEVMAWSSNHNLVIEHNHDANYVKPKGKK